MAMLKDEIQMLKAVSMEIDSDHMLLVTEQYHTEKTDDGQKQNRAKSMYRWYARVMNITNLKAKIDVMLDDDHRLNKFKIPNDPSGYYLCIGKYATSGAAAEWIEKKMNKRLSWEEGQKRLAGYQKKTAKHDEMMRPDLAYPITGYTAENGDAVDLNDKDALLKHVNQNLIKPIK